MAFQGPGPLPGQGQPQTCQDRHVPGNEEPVMGGGAPCAPQGCWGNTTGARLPHGCWEGSQGLSGALCSHHTGTAPTSAPSSFPCLARLASPACPHGWWQTRPTWPEAPFPKLPRTAPVLSGIQTIFSRGTKLSTHLACGHRVGGISFSPGAAQPCLFQEAFSGCVSSGPPFLSLLHTMSFSQLQRGKELIRLQVAPNQDMFESAGGTLIYYGVMLGEHWDCSWQIMTYGCPAYNTIIGYLLPLVISFLSNKTNINGKGEGGKGKGKIKSTGSCICSFLVEPQFPHL